MSNAKKDMYLALTNSHAWKDLESWATHEADASMKSIDNTPATELNLGKVCEERGYRRGLMRIIQQAKFMAEGR